MSRGPRLCVVIAGLLSASGCSAPSETSLGDGASAIAAKPTELRPGEVAELAVVDGIAGGTFTVAGPAGASGPASYVVIVASTKYEATTTPLAWSLDTTTAPTSASVRPVVDCSLDSDRWAATSVPEEPAPTGTAAKVGTTKTLHAWTPSGYTDIEVKAVAAGDKAVVWADITPAHPATLDASFATQFLSDFEQTILPRSRSVFGVESDLDGDGHIALVFTPLTRQTSVAFFAGCDLVKWDDCPVTNAGEYLWLSPPNAIDPPYNTPNAIKEILSHELAHLIHFNRKVLRNHLTSWLDSGYMDEGVGGFAQDAIGPQAGNLYVAMAGLQGISDFSLADTLVDGTHYDKSRDGALRGGSYLFVRWLYDRAGGDIALSDGAIAGRGGPALLRALLDAPTSVAKALPTTTHSSLADLGMDFYTALAMSNREEAGGVAPASSCFAYRPTQVDPITGKQRGANLFARFHGSQMPGVAMTDARSGTLRLGGATFITLSPTAGQLPLTVRVDPTAAPRVRVARIR